MTTKLGTVDAIFAYLSSKSKTLYYNQSSLLSNTYNIKTLTVFLHPMKGISYLRA
jgi:hypothetical protein